VRGRLPTAKSLRRAREILFVGAYSGPIFGGFAFRPYFYWVEEMEALFPHEMVLAGKPSGVVS